MIYKMFHNNVADIYIEVERIKWNTSVLCCSAISAMIKELFIHEN